MFKILGSFCKFVPLVRQLFFIHFVALLQLLALRLKRFNGFLKAGSLLATACPGFFHLELKGLNLGPFLFKVEGLLFLLGLALGQGLFKLTEFLKLLFELRDLLDLEAKILSGLNLFALDLVVLLLEARQLILKGLERAISILKWNMEKVNREKKNIV